MIFTNVGAIIEQSLRGSGECSLFAKFFFFAFIIIIIIIIFLCLPLNPFPIFLHYHNLPPTSVSPRCTPDSTPSSTCYVEQYETLIVTTSVP